MSDEHTHEAEPELTPEQQAEKDRIAAKIRELREKEAAKERERQQTAFTNRYTRIYEAAKLDGKSHDEADKEAMEMLEALGLTLPEEKDEVQEVSE